MDQVEQDRRPPQRLVEQHLPQAGLVEFATDHAQPQGIENGQRRERRQIAGYE